MKTIDMLKKEALESCRFRGHNMGHFNQGKSGRGRGRITALSYCKTPSCGGWVCVDTFPPPDGIDIGGSAVALHCPAPTEP